MQALGLTARAGLSSAPHDTDVGISSSSENSPHR